MTAGRIMVDSNVLLDVLTEDKTWFGWSGEQLASFAEKGRLVINPVIYAEVSIGFDRVEELEAALGREFFHYADLPCEAAFLAGKCFLRYRRAGGLKSSPLPDFFIGAHAAVESIPLLTRDISRYRTYFPSLEIISP
ncbi:MAG: type II toxin-antitoxin system VapC family toxin [Thermodesulfobacteriota bacterium]